MSDSLVFLIGNLSGIVELNSIYICDLGPLRISPKSDSRIFFPL